MNSIAEPATETQLSYLRRLGQHVDFPLSRLEAAQLIRQSQDQQAAEMQRRAEAMVEHEPQQLHVKVDRAKGMARTGSGSAILDLERATTERQEYWMDTCREIGQRKFSYARILALYREHGCRFQVPTHQQVQAILDALDAAAPTWDKDHPELFYQTLELNYPSLVRRH